MSPQRRHALAVVDVALHRQRDLHRLSPDERRAVETLAASIAVQVADAIDAVFAEAAFYGVPERETLDLT
jgi:hypothetical protein